MKNDRKTYLMEEYIIIGSVNIGSKYYILPCKSHFSDICSNSTNFFPI